MHQNEAYIVDVGVMWLGAGGGCQHGRLAGWREPQSLKSRWIYARATRAGIDQSANLEWLWNRQAGLLERLRSSLADSDTKIEERTSGSDLYRYVWHARSSSLVMNWGCSTGCICCTKKG